MPVLSRDDLRNQLKKRDIAPVYLLFGGETYLRDLAAKTIANLLFDENSLRDLCRKKLAKRNYHRQRRHQTQEDRHGSAR